jgi:hypothetical protein
LGRSSKNNPTTHFGEKIERVLEVYADGCPVARSVKESIEISRELDLTLRSFA